MTRTEAPVEHIMRIGIYVSHFPRISETFIQRLVLGLLEEGHDVTIIADRRAPESQYQDTTARVLRAARVVYRGRIASRWPVRLLQALGVAVRTCFYDPAATIHCLSPRRFGVYALSFYPFLEAAPFIVHGSDLDIVHAQYGHLGLRLAKLLPALKPSWKLAVSFRGNDISSGLKKRGREGYRELSDRGDLFLPVSEYFRKRLLTLGFPKSKVHVLRSGIQLADYSQTYSRGRPNEGFQIVTVGRLNRKKGKILPNLLFSFQK